MGLVGLFCKVKSITAFFKVVQDVLYTSHTVHLFTTLSSESYPTFLIREVSRG